MNRTDGKWKGVTGIYAILCVATGMYYIGGTKDLHRRNQDHRRELGAGRHHSSHLQRAWDKHGAEAFSFEVIEPCSRKIVGEREQWYLDSFRPFDHEIGYNNKSTISWNTTQDMSPEVKAALGKSHVGKRVSEETKDKLRQDWKVNWNRYTQNAIELRGGSFRVQSPTGEIVEGRGIRDFCRQNDLDHSQFSRVLRGENGHIKGWTLPGVDRCYRFLDPVGTKYSVAPDELEAFTLTHDLVRASMSGVWTGRLRHHKGWCHADRKNDMYVTLSHRDGRRQTMCRKCYTRNAHVVGLHPGTFSRLMGGQKQEVGGWRIEPITA